MLAAFQIPCLAVATIGIGPMLEQPGKGVWIERLAGGKDDGIPAITIPVHVRAMLEEQVHHGNAVAK